MKTPGYPDNAAERRRHRATESDARPEDRDRAARLSGELPVVPRRPQQHPGAPSNRPGDDLPSRRPVEGAPGRAAPPVPPGGPVVADPTGRPDRRPGPVDGGPRNGRPNGPVPHRGGPDRPGPASGNPVPSTPGGPGPVAGVAAATTGLPYAPARPGGPRGRRPEDVPGSTWDRPARPPLDGASGAPTTAAKAGAEPGSTPGRDHPVPTGRTRPSDTARRTLGAALGLTAAAAVLPGTGHLALRRRRTGALILGTLIAVVVALGALAFGARRSTLLQNLLSTTTLTVLAGAVVLAGVGWIAQIARTYALARPLNMARGRKILGTGVAALMCLTMAVPFGYGVELLSSQRGLLNSLFQGGGTNATEALGKPRLNVLLLGSDAGDDRTGTRTDTMMLASIDTRSGRTTLFSLPRNIQRSEFPQGTPAAEKFPNGFHNESAPSGDYLLNAIYAYGEQHPQIAPPGPTPNPGLNLLQSSVSYMTGLPIDYYLEVDMAGFSSMVDALGGVTVNVGDEPLPVGGVTAFGRHVQPDYYLKPGTQTLNGYDALWFARSRRNGTDYQRMGRQRCLIQAMITQTSVSELLARFQRIAAVTKDNVQTDMPQQVLPALAFLADENFTLESVAFDPSLPDPNSPTGFFVTAKPDVDYMREVVRNAVADPPPPGAVTPPTGPQAPASTPSTPASGSAAAGPDSAAPQSVAETCAAAGATDEPPGDQGEAGPGGDESSGSNTTTSSSGPVQGIRPDGG